MNKASKRVAQMDVLKMRPTTPDVGLRSEGAMVFGGKEPESSDLLPLSVRRLAGREIAGSNHTLPLRKQLAYLVIARRCYNTECAVSKRILMEFKLGQFLFFLSFFLSSSSSLSVCLSMSICLHQCLCLCQFPSLWPFLSV